MNTVSNDDVSNAYDVFCRVQGFAPDKMTNCYEFSMFLGFSLLNQFRYIDNDTGIIVKPGVNRVVDALNGPHSETVVRVWMAKRYSFTGRLKAFWKKPMHRMGFMCISFAAFVKESLQ